MEPTSPPTLSDAQQRRASKKQAIVESAAALFAELGYADCEMERVAAGAGIAKGTLYLYFPGKQDLFFAAMDWGMSLLGKAVREASDTTTEPFEKIVRAVRAYLTFFDQHPAIVELMMQERANFRERTRPTYNVHRDENRVFWRELYEKLIASGQIRSDITAQQILDTLGNLVYGTMFTNHIIGRGTATLDEQCRTIMEVLFRGVLSDSTRCSWRAPACICPERNIPVPQ